MIRTVYVVFFVLIFIAPVFAATYTVCSSGCDYTTMSAAASGVPSGEHTISVSGGPYSGFQDDGDGAGSGQYRYWIADGSVTITSRVYLTGWDVKFEGFILNQPAGSNNCLASGQHPTGTGRQYILNNTFISCYGHSIRVRGTGTIIENNDISRMRTNGDADGMHLHGSDHTITGNYIHDIRSSEIGNAHADGIQTYEDAGYGLSDSIIEKNRIYMGEDGVGLIEAVSAVDTIYGLMLAGTSNLTVRNNIIEAWGGQQTGASGNDPNSNLKLYNNTFVSDISFTNAYGGYGINDNNGTGTQVYNNILCNFRNTSRGAVVVADVGISIDGDNNLFWNSDSTPIVHLNYNSGGNDVTGSDPLFITKFTNLQLQSGSPAKDAGYDLTGTVTDDYDGAVRPQGDNYDIGAYEYVATQGTYVKGISIQ